MILKMIRKTMKKMMTRKQMMVMKTMKMKMIPIAKILIPIEEFFLMTKKLKWLSLRFKRIWNSDQTSSNNQLQMMITKGKLHSVTQSWMMIDWPPLLLR